jgi:uncharacterized NAD(P)/FAD-binding protein YdhS
MALASLFISQQAWPQTSSFAPGQMDNLINEEGRASEMLYAIGPLRKAALWETTAVPEIRNQCSDLAERLIPQLIQRAPLHWEI